MTPERARVKVDTNTIFLFIVSYSSAKDVFQREEVSYGKCNNVGNQERSYPFGTHWSIFRPSCMVGRREILMCLLRGDSDNAAVISRVFLDEGGARDLPAGRKKIGQRAPLPHSLSVNEGLVVMQQVRFFTLNIYLLEAYL